MRKERTISLINTENSNAKGIDYTRLYEYRFLDIPQKGMLVEPDGLGCFRVTSKTSNLEMSFRLSEPGSLRFYTDLGENITLTAYQKNAKATKEIGVANKTWQFLSIAWPANKVKISFPNQSATTLCEISVMGEK